jgi:hypothetical protein
MKPDQRRSLLPHPRYRRIRIPPRLIGCFNVAELARTQAGF